GDTGPPRPADVPARASPGAPAGEEPLRRPAAVPLPDARTGGDARSLQGHRRRGRPPPPRISCLVFHPDVPPLPASTSLPEAARRGGLDRRAPVPSRHRRVGPARPHQARRRVTSSDFARAIAFRRESALRRANRAVRTDHGVALFTDDLPRVWFLNHLLV